MNKLVFQLEQRRMMDSANEQIRQARPNESELLSELGLRAKAVWGYSDEAMTTFRSELQITNAKIASGDVYVLVAYDSVTGYYALRPTDASTVELQHLFIDPEHLHQGYGTQLLQHAIERARAGRYHRLIIQSDPNATVFYEKQGIPIVELIPSSIPGRTIPLLELIL